ncbi:MAG TPA: hypothetical protein VGP68_06245 [Gemmataceae bacterium]|jgi:hypothetical protein|nr:hypothetical protein [Gemmataceae bacterium]
MAIEQPFASFLPFTGLLPTYFLQPTANWPCARGTKSAIEKTGMAPPGFGDGAILPELSGKGISTALGEVATENPRKTRAWAEK